MITTDNELDECLSEPTPGVISALDRLEGDIVLLGVGGKMGPSLAVMAKRASLAAGARRRVIGVSRFSSGEGEITEAFLQSHGVETVRCDLLDHDEDAVRRQLPSAPNVVFLAGMKFGTTGNAALTWAMNAYVPSLVCRIYRESRIVAFSTGNVYGLSPADQNGSREDDVLAPVGEYAQSCLGRERIFEYFSRAYGTKIALLRINYACDLRYGVLTDLARNIAAGTPVDCTMGYFNTIWQGDANAFALQAFGLAACPPWIANVTGPERLSVREVGEQLGQLLGKPATFVGEEAPCALLSDSSRALERFGPPRVSASDLIAKTADWVRRGGSYLNKPTHFESRDGRF